MQRFFRKCYDPLKRLPGRVWLVLALTVLTVMAWEILLPFFGVSAQQVRLPDGNIYKLAAVTYGKEHAFDPRTPVQKVKAFVSAGLLAVLGLPMPPGGQQYKSWTTNESIGLWFLIQKANPTNDSHVNIGLLDAGGRICREGDATHSFGISPTVGGVGELFQAFPRRSRMVVVQLSAWNATNHQREVLASFLVPNPGWKWSVPAWKPEPLPITRRDGNLEFILTKLVSGLVYNGPITLASNSWDFSTLVLFAVNEKGRGLTNWQPTRIVSCDAAGNVAQNRRSSIYAEKGEQGMVYQWGLDPEASAWKMRVEFARTSGFAPEEIWTVNGISTNQFLHQDWWGDLPATNLIARTNLSGKTLEIAGLCERMDWDGRRVIVKMRVKPATPDYRLTLLEATDDQGRQIRLGGSSWGDALYEFRLADLQDAKALNIKVAFHQKRYAEFMAKPEMARLGAYPLAGKPVGETTPTP